MPRLLIRQHNASVYPQISNPKATFKLVFSQIAAFSKGKGARELKARSKVVSLRSELTHSNVLLPAGPLINNALPNVRLKEPTF